MEKPDLEEKKESREKNSPYWVARRKGEERDRLIQEHLKTDEVTTVALTMQYLGMEPTASNRRIIEQRLHRLVEGKRARKIRESYTTYYVTPGFLKGRDRPQFDHRLLETRWWVYLKETGLVIEDRRSSSELRIQGGTVIPDGVCIVGSTAVFLEADNGTESLDIIRAKAERYHNDAEYQRAIYGFQSYRVVFLTTSERRAQNIAEKLQGIGSGWSWLVTAADTLGTFICVKDMQVHPLIEES